MAGENPHETAARLRKVAAMSVVIDDLRRGLRDEPALVLHMLREQDAGFWHAVARVADAKASMPSQTTIDAVLALYQARVEMAAHPPLGSGSVAVSHPVDVDGLALFVAWLCGVTWEQALRHERFADVHPNDPRFCGFAALRHAERESLVDVVECGLDGAVWAAEALGLTMDDGWNSVLELFRSMGGDVARHANERDASARKAGF